MVVSAVAGVCCVVCTEGSRQLILCLVRCSAFHTASVAPVCAARCGDSSRLMSTLCGGDACRSSRCPRGQWLTCVRGASLVSARCVRPAAGGRRGAVLPTSGVSAPSPTTCSRRAAGARSLLFGGATRSAVHAWSRSNEAVHRRRVGASSARGDAKTSNQAMQLTASKRDVYASGVCRRERMLRAMHMGLAAADLVSR